MPRLEIKTNEVILKEDNEWLYFAEPHRIVTAERLEDVLPALHEIERLLVVKDWYAAGFLSYEAAPAFDPSLQTCASSAFRNGNLGLPSGLTAEFPFLWFGLYPKPDQIELPKPEKLCETLNWQPTIDRVTYNAAITTIRERIGEGRTYQVNYTMRLQADRIGSPWDLFLQLAQAQNKHAAYVDTGRYAICSASPELFFELHGNIITCCPMKGTTPRGRTTLEDLAQSQWLKNSEKNRAENVMIVDMVRNDLGKIAETGSIGVPELFETERYPTLWQMTSTVTAKTTASISEIFAALFPCASITGAPKVSTMKFISELETTPRRIYTGSIGYIVPGRKAKFNVAIRTALVDRVDQKAEYGVGGGIVWDSNSSDEYAEALLKARVLTEPQPFFSLLETMLWTPEKGFFLHEKHIARMIDSADYFDIPINRSELEKYLGQISSSFHTPQRVRVLLDLAGRLGFEAKPHEQEGDFNTIRACLAEQPIDSSNVFLFHKTTERTMYESARANCEEVDDVLLYNEAGELTEFTIGNLVVELDGRLLTSPISCGVLPGTFRAHLIETGQIIEQVIPMERLKDCKQLFRVNSIRKWQRVEFEKNSIESGLS